MNIQQEAAEKVEALAKTMNVLRMDNHALKEQLVAAEKAYATLLVRLGELA
jgi:hypothetical protein